MKRFSVLVSGGGTNLQSLMDAVAQGRIGARIASVISSRADAYALERANAAGIPTRVITKRDYPDQAQRDAALLAALRADGADFVVMAGYLSIIGEAVVAAYRNRIINIHPALLPNFGGKGYYGINVHRAVLDAGVRVSGATVHFVDEGTDTGPIILQRCVAVQANDTPETLQRRVLSVEHEMLPLAVGWMAQDRLRVDGRRVLIEEENGMGKRAFLSVSDKTGIVDFARGLAELGFEIISTGGTEKTLREGGVATINVSEITGFPECLDGRVKTLHPAVHAGILAMRDNPEHMAQIVDVGIAPIDVVCVNLYPFKQTVLKEGVGFEECVENIDIGGPAMLRSAAKNHRDVAVAVDSADYPLILDELSRYGAVRIETKRQLCHKVFAHTAAYDALIASYMRAQTGAPLLGDTLTLTYENVQSMRYGENPHQQAAFYREADAPPCSLANAEQLNGKALSYNNIADANAALELLREFTDEKGAAVVAVKHANPCGVAVADSCVLAYEKAHAADPVSIFGGIVAVNVEVDEAAAKKMAETFLEIIIAPSYTDAALKALRAKKNLRVLRLPGLTKLPPEGTLDFKRVTGGLLVQGYNAGCVDACTVVTKQKPTDDQLRQLMLAWRIVKHVKSNAICLVNGGASAGIGAGQVNRIWAVEQAVEHAGARAAGAVLASDAFFPFEDCVLAAAKAGITAIIQPGGSVRDADSIKAADAAGIAMVFTGMRHFKH